MRKKTLTIWIAPDISKKIRCITLYHTVIKLAIVALLTGAIGISSIFITFMTRYKAIKKKVVTLEVLKDENKKQQEQIDYFTKTLRGLEEQVSKLSEFSKQLRLMTSLEPVKSGKKPDSEYGLGGPIGEGEDLWEDSASPRSSLKEGQGDISASIEDLRAQISIEKQSFQEIERALKRQKTLLLYTPSSWPVRGWVASGFGKRISPFTGKIEMHKGIDILAKTGTSIKAPANGVVSKVAIKAGLGNFITINHGYGITTCYGHNKKNLVRKGERVSRGQAIAQVGNTGHTTGPHLHYEVIVKGKYANPLHYILD